LIEAKRILQHMRYKNGDPLLI